MRFIAITLVLMTATSFPRRLVAEDAPKMSPEFQVLDRFIGDWDDAIINKTAGQKYNAIEHRKWSPLGEFVLSEDQNLSTKKEAHFLITHDPNANVYRACFIEAGSAALLLGTWDDKASAMTWSGPPEVNVKYAGTHRFIDKDHAEWSITVTGQDGTVYAEMSGKQTRRK
jgi:hypothetical protein